MPDKTSMNIETKSGVIDLDSVKDNKTSPSQTINVMPDIKQRAHKMFDERFGQLPDMIEIDIKSFIDEIIDMRDKEIIEMIEKLPQTKKGEMVYRDIFQNAIIDLIKPKLSADETQQTVQNPDDYIDGSYRAEYNRWRDLQDSHNYIMSYREWLVLSGKLSAEALNIK